MSNLIYGNIENAKEGDIVERITEGVNGYSTKGNLYILPEQTILNRIRWSNDKESITTSLYKNWKLIKTKPGNTVKPGDKVICIYSYNNDNPSYPTIGEVYIAQPSTTSAYVYWDIDSPNYSSTLSSHFLVLQEKEEKEIPYYNKPEYISYFKTLYEKGIKLRKGGTPVTEPSSFEFNDWIYRLASDPGDCPLLVTEPSSFEFNDWIYRLVSDPDDCPLSGTDAYAKYWENKKRTNKIYTYYDDGIKHIVYDDLVVNANTLSPWIKSHKVFFIGEENKTTHNDSYDSNVILDFNRLNPTPTIQKENTMKTIQKENTMKTITTIELKVNGKDFITEPAAVDMRTDLEAKPKYLGVWYDDEGKQKTEPNNYSKKRAKAEMQKADNLGDTLVLYKLESTFTTKIPVVETKA